MSDQISPNQQLAPKGIDRQSLLSQMAEMKSADVQWQQGKAFSYVYYAGEEVLEVVKEAYQLFFSENALNPTAFESLRRMENEVLSMAARLFGGDEEVVGSMTSGGTESILMAVKTAREWAKKHRPEVHHPEVVLAASAHPAFHKACHYFGVKAVVVPVGADFRAQVGAMAAAISDQTVLLVASAPSYPQGVVDPVAEIAALAKERGLLCHVDACVGGFMLPFLRQLDYPIPAFDFGVDGVTSISADIHKYGYAAKGASVVLYRNGELRKCQYYVYTDWSGGIYGSPSMTGTRPGGAIAAAWAVMKYMGLEGYQKQAKIAMETALDFRKGIEAIPELKILGQPDMTIMAVASDQLDVYEVGDEMGMMGWSIDRQQLPPSLHLTITPVHAQKISAFMGDLEQAVAKARKISLHSMSKQLQIKAIRGLKKTLPAGVMDKFQAFAAKYSKVGGKRSAAMYGMMGELQGEEGQLDDMIKTFLDKLYR
ncbi:MAG: aspartate aminotransferase family protein [Bacteroidota bacterium]